MNAMDDIIGRIALSKAGRDKGGRFAVIAVADDGHVLIADGKKHKLDRPKKKKLIHLSFERARVEDIEKLMASPGGTGDAALRRALSNDHD